jgi:hypothetical protein
MSRNLKNLGLYYIFDISFKFGDFESCSEASKVVKNEGKRYDQVCFNFKILYNKYVLVAHALY